MSSVLSFLWRHKRKFIIGGMVIGGTYFAASQCLSYVLKWQEKKARMLIEMTKKQQHFENTERTCDGTILSLISSLYESIDRHLDTKSILRLLKSGTPNKVELWEDLKVLVFARACLLVYGAVILNVIVRTQINIIGGYLYQSTTNKLVQLPGNLQEQYLSLCHCFLDDGMKQLSDLIITEVKYEVGHLRLGEKIDADKLERLLWTIQSSVDVSEYNPLASIDAYIFRSSQFQNIEAVELEELQLLEQLVIETKDILSSDEVYSIASPVVCEGFQWITNKLKECFVPEEMWLEPLSSDSFESSCSLFPNTRSGDIKSHAPLKSVAKILPIINSLTEAPHSTDLHSTFIYSFIQNETLKNFGLNVYEAFCD